MGRAHDPSKSTYADGSNGPWCVVEKGFTFETIWWRFNEKRDAVKMAKSAQQHFHKKFTVDKREEI